VARVDGFDYEQRPSASDPLAPPEERGRRGRRRDEGEGAPREKAPSDPKRAFWKKVRARREGRGTRR
jgi:hypothetical protein